MPTWPFAAVRRLRCADGGAEADRLLDDAIDSKGDLEACLPAAMFDWMIHTQRAWIV